MDFRENWLRHFRAVVDREIKANGGSAVAGRTAVARNLEKGEQTIYQHYAQRSGKVYPTVEMMLLLEKKYGDGRPPGWSALGDSEAAPIQKRTDDDLTLALAVVARAIENADEIRRLALVPMFSSLVNDPSKSGTIARAVNDLMGRAAATTPRPETQPRSLPGVGMEVSEEKGTSNGSGDSATESTGKTRSG